MLLLRKVARLDLFEVPIVPFVSEEIVYLSADAEDRYTIAQATTPLSEAKEFLRALGPRAAASIARSLRMLARFRAEPVQVVVFPPLGF